MPVSTGVSVDAVTRIGVPPASAVGASSVRERLSAAVRWMKSSTSSIRSGIIPGSGGAVTITGGSWFLTPASYALSDGAGGVYEVNNVVTKTEVMPTAPGAGTSRYDALVLEPFDTGAASGRYFKVRLYYGTASGSPSLAATLALVPSGATVVATALTTNTGSTVTQIVLPRTVTVGGVLPLASQAEQTTVETAGLFKGLHGFRDDLGYGVVNTTGAAGGWESHYGSSILGSGSSATSANNTVNTGFVWVVETTGVLTLSFVAPPSGQVELTNSAYLVSNATGVSVLMGYRITGGLTRDPTTDESLRVYSSAGSAAVRSSVNVTLTGLTPGTSYTLTSAVTASSAGVGVVTVQDRKLVVKAL